MYNSTCHQTIDFIVAVFGYIMVWIWEILTKGIYIYDTQKAEQLLLSTQHIFPEAHLMLLHGLTIFRQFPGLEGQLGSAVEN